MKTFYALLLAVTLGMTMTGQAYAAQNGGQAGKQSGYSGTGYNGGGAGDMVQQRNQDQDCDYAGTGDCDGDQLQQRDRDHQQLQDRDQDCQYAGTGDCDGDQLQQRDRVHTQDPQYTAEDLNRMQRLLEQLRGAFGRLYGWN